MKKRGTASTEKNNFFSGTRIANGAKFFWHNCTKPWLSQTNSAKQVKSISSTSAKCVSSPAEAEDHIQLI